MFKDDMILAAEAEENSKSDHLGGFFASVVLALLTCSWGSWMLLWIAEAVGLSPTIYWGHNLTAALFVSILMADPISAVLEKQMLRRVLGKAVIGLALGGALQHWVVTPIAGGGVSLFIFLALAMAMLPMMMAMNAIESALESRGIVLSEKFSRVLIELLRMPRAIPIVLLALIVFQMFWRIAPTALPTMVAIGLGLVGVLAIALRESLYETEESVAAAAAPKAFATYSGLAWHESRVFLRYNLAPVVFFAGLFWFTIAVLPGQSYYQPVAVKFHALIGVPMVSVLLHCGLALALGAGVGLLAGRLLLRLIGKIARLPNEDIVIRALIFRDALFLRG